MPSNKPIVEGYTAGGGALLLSVLWIIYSQFHPLLIFFVYLLGISILMYTILLHVSGESNPKDWLIDHPVRFFFLGFGVIFSVIVFLDIFFLGKWGGILVEAHGLLFDLLIFGILLTLYDVIRNKRDRVVRFKEELNDYRGWTEDEAAYRVAGIIRRLQKEKVNDIDLSRLHLGLCSKDIIEIALKNPKNEIASLEKANLERSNLDKLELREMNFKKANLTYSSLIETNFIEANLEDADLSFSKLQNAKMNISNLKEAYLNQADLKGANLTGAELEKIILWQSNLQNTNFTRANLTDAKLWRSNCNGASFYEANLEGADLFHADLSNTNFKKAILLNVNFENARVDRMNWFEILKEWDVSGIEELEDKFFIDPTPRKDDFQVSYFIINKRK